MSIQMDRDLPQTGVNRAFRTDRPARPNTVGWVLLGISALGLPLTLGAIRRMRRLGGLAAEIGYGILLTRATIMITGGAPRRMKSVTALFLYLELVADVIGFATGLWALVWSPLRVRFHAAATRMSESSAPIGESWIERVAVAAAAPIYLLHTVRLAIYVSPGRGLRECRGAVEELETAAVARRVDTNVLGIVSMVNRVALRTPCPQARCPAAIRFLAQIVIAFATRGKDLVVPTPGQVG